MPILVLSVAALALYACTRLLLVAPCWAVLTMAAAVAWPIWIGRREYALFQHRLALEAATIVASRVRRLLWRGRITSFTQALSAFFWAAVLLAFAPLLHPWHLALLAADAVLLALLVPYARRLLAADVRVEYLGLFARRWPLPLFNVAFLAASFFVIDYFLVGAPDTRAMDWGAVATRAYGEYSGAACPLVGMAVGAINAADRLNWHAAEVLIPGLPGSGLQLVAWLVFLLQAGAVAFAYTRYLLGALAATSQPVAPTPIVSIAAVLLLGAWMLRDFDPSVAAPAARALVHRLDPCRAAGATVAAARKGLDKQIAAAAATDRERTAARIDAELDRLFAKAEGGVDAYLDWYFSVIGEYTRLTAYLFNREKNYLEQRLFVDTGVGEALAEANRRIAAEAAPQLTAVAAQLGPRLRAEAASHPCLRQAIDVPGLPSMERDVVHATASIASGLAVAGIATARVAAGRLSAGAAARLASKRAYGSAAGLAGRVVGKRGGSLLVSAGAGAACGPFALLCGLVTWIAVDQGIVMVDEALFRKEMRAEILDAVREQKAELAREMRAVHGAAIDATAERLHVAVNGVFIPARDGHTSGKP